MVYIEIATKELDLKQNIVTLPSLAQIIYFEGEFDEYITAIIER